MSATIAEVAVALIAQAKQKADEIFKAYSDIDEVFITSDLQGFTEETRAENHTDHLADKRFYRFQRDADFEDKPAQDNAEPSTEKTQNAGNGDPSEVGNEPDENDGEPDTSGDPSNTISNEPNAGNGTPNADDTEERIALFAEYEQLFGQKPQHNIGTAKLKAKINKKKEELKVQG